VNERGGVADKVYKGRVTPQTCTRANMCAHDHTHAHLHTAPTHREKGGKREKVTGLDLGRRWFAVSSFALFLASFLAFRHLSLDFCARTIGCRACQRKCLSYEFFVGKRFLESVGDGQKKNVFLAGSTPANSAKLDKFESEEDDVPTSAGKWNVDVK